MNIREAFLISKDHNFIGTDTKWQNNSIFKLEERTIGDKIENFLKDNQILLGVTTEPLIYINDLKFNEPKINPDLIIFASRHTSKTARPAFLAHTTGNWGNKADFGGKPQDLSKTSALLHKAGIESLREQIENFNNPDFS